MTTISKITEHWFQPDLVWVKGRTSSYNHRLFDSLRGMDVYLYIQTPPLVKMLQMMGWEVNMANNGFTIIDNPDGANTSGLGK